MKKIVVYIAKIARRCMMFMVKLLRRPLYITNGLSNTQSCNVIIIIIILNEMRCDLLTLIFNRLSCP